MTQENQRLLNWLNKEKKRDEVELDFNKKRFIQEIRKQKKENLIPTPPKLTIWKKIRLIILGY